jgi:uncharacterized protein YuzE
MTDRRVPLRVTYDESVDAAYIYLQAEIGSGGSARTICLDPIEVGGMVNLDVDADGRILGVEVLAASKLLPVELLDSIAHP